MPSVARRNPPLAGLTVRPCNAIRFGVESRPSTVATEPHALRPTMIQRRVLPSLVLAAGLAASAGAGATPPPAADASPSATAALLDPPFKSTGEGIELQPPAGGTTLRQLDSGEIARFQYPDRAWTIVLKSAPNSAHLPLTTSPSAPDHLGLLELSAAQLTDRAGKPATLVRKEVVPIGPRQVGLIEADDAAGTSPVFVQLALVPDRAKYFVLEMISPAQAPAAAARDAFERMLATVELPDPGIFRAEQDRRLDATRWLWLQLDQQRILSALQPVHFMRIVRDGKDVGYVQVNERAEQHHDQDGVYVVAREHIESPDAPSAPAAPVDPAPGATPGVDLPPATVAGAAPVARSSPKQLDRDARFFATFDRAHEDWTAVTRLDNRPGNDALEMGNSDVESHLVYDRQLARQQVVVGRQGDEPPVITRQIDTLQVDNYRGKPRSGPSVQQQLPPYYLPQALAQLLPRLLPIDQPRQYLFAFYVSEQRKVLYRYVDVGAEREVMLDGQPVRAIPIGDRIGADGVVTTHYVSRSDGQWLGSASDDGRLLVLPADEATLRATWKGFTVLPDPPPPVDDERASRPSSSSAVPAQRPPSPPTDALPSILPPSLDSSGMGGR
jgi:hypothetical protein